MKTAVKDQTLTFVNFRLKHHEMWILVLEFLLFLDDKDDSFLS